MAKSHTNLRDIWNRIETFLKIIFIILLSICLYHNLEDYHYNKLVDFNFKVPFKNVPRTSQRNESIKYILFWTPWWHLTHWTMGAEVLYEDYLKAVDCPVTNCVFSHDRRFLPKPTDYDALVFHMGNVKGFDDLPAYRREDQIYILANEEAPFFSRPNLTTEANFFNMTFSYRMNSDIFWNYGLFADIETGSIVAPSKNVKWKEPEIVDNPELIEFIKTSKTKMAAWFVSHCYTPSTREKLAAKIQEFIPVDIYGKCGSPACPIKDIYNLDERQPCTDMLNTTYKFYFSFENSICTDYITEKAFLNMENYVIPILYNGVANMQHFLPPHSYIHVNDSSSIEDLVNYLKYLDNNPQEYANYFWWKKYYKIIPDTNPYTYCEMCMKVNDWNVEEKRQVYMDVYNWHSSNTCYDLGYYT